MTRASQQRETDMAKQSDIADKLDEARALIETRGWVQCDFEDAQGRLCAAGAMNRTGGIGAGTESGQIARGFFIDATGATPIGFNDAPGRTQAEVIEAFRKAAELARAEA